MNKKGQSEFVAYVLLIGLAVTLAVIVGQWSINQSQDSSSNVVNQAAISEKCDLTSIASYIKCVDNTAGSPEPKEVHILNKGNLEIKNLKVISESVNCLPSGYNKEKGKEVNLKPNTDVRNPHKIQLTNFNCNSIIVSPFVKVNDDLYGCSEKRVVLKVVC